MHTKVFIQDHSRYVKYTACVLYNVCSAEPPDV